jgi:hypothetical protein
MSRLLMRAMSRVQRQNCILDFNDSARRAAELESCVHSIPASVARALRRLSGRRG